MTQTETHSTTDRFYFHTAVSFTEPLFRFVELSCWGDTSAGPPRWRDAAVRTPWRVSLNRVKNRLITVNDSVEIMPSLACERLDAGERETQSVCCWKRDGELEKRKSRWWWMRVGDSCQMSVSLLYVFVIGQRGLILAHHHHYCRCVCLWESWFTVFRVFELVIQESSGTRLTITLSQICHDKADWHLVM